MATDQKNFTQDMLENTDLLIDVSESATVSNALDMRGKTLVGLIMPAALTSTSITFTGSDDNVTFRALTNTSGTALTVTVSASKHICIVPADFASVRWLKLIMGSSEGADRTIIAVMRAV
jgi:hypothetical protein